MLFEFKMKIAQCKISLIFKDGALVNLLTATVVGHFLLSIKCLFCLLNHSKKSRSKFTFSSFSFDRISCEDLSFNASIS